LLYLLLGEPFTVTLALIVADVWKTTPFVSILLLAGLQTIPADLYEAHSLVIAIWLGSWLIRRSRKTSGLVS